MLRFLGTCLSAVLLAGIAAASIAQQPGAQDDKTETTVFPASYYAGGEPANAMDVANRTPGFAFDRGDTQVRGLEGSSGNVMIDGRWPTAKAIPLSEILTGIPFSTIERAEIIRAGAAGFDTLGKQVVLNIVRKASRESVLSVEAALRKYSDNDRELGGSSRIEFAQSRGKLNLNAGLVYKSEQLVFSAGEGEYSRTTVSPQALLSGWFDNDDWQKSVQATANADYTWTRFDLALNLSATNTQTLIDHFGDYEDLNAQPFDEIVDIERDSDVFEVGLNLNGLLASNRRLNVRLLHRSESQQGDASLSMQDRQVLADDEFDSAETAARTALRWEATPTLSLEAGAEAAFNELDSFVEVIAGGVPLELPNANIKVEEDRYQFFVKAIAKLGDRWLLEAGADYEASKLQQSGDANLSKRFDFLKPRLTASWSLNAFTDLRFRVEKVVGQLSFSSFAASPSLESGILAAGNAELEPEESEEYELQLEQRFWKEGSAILTYTHARLKNALDYIPVGTGFDARGNAGKATKDTWVLDLNLPLDRLGWEAATFRTNLNYIDSEITDPFTGVSRSLSGRDAWTGSLGLTWELPAWKSVIGFNGFWGYYEREYRISEQRLRREYPIPLSVWWDRTFADDLIVRLEVAHLASPRRTRTREIYADGRANSAVSSVEVRKNEQEPHFMIKVRKRF